MPAYNASKYIARSIESVLSQSYDKWELLIIDDGSTDNTKNIIFSFSDPRIHYYYQSNQGVSAARNVALNIMKGEYFCLLDADDIFLPRSLEARLDVFRNSTPSLEFVDGAIEIVDENLGPLRVFTPWLKDKNPFFELVALKQSCYLKQSWLIRRVPGKAYQMSTSLTHGEDLFFSMEISRKGGKYDYTNETILLYRQHHGSAMRNLDGLNHSYFFIFNALKSWPEVPVVKRLLFLLKARKIMFLSFMFDGKSVKKAFRSLVRWQ